MLPCVAATPTADMQASLAFGLVKELRVLATGIPIYILESDAPS